MGSTTTHLGKLTSELTSKLVRSSYRGNYNYFLGLLVQEGVGVGVIMGVGRVCGKNP